MQAKEKYTLFIRNREGRWIGVKSRKQFVEVLEFADTEYRAYTAAGKAFITDNNRRIVWDAGKHSG